MPYHGPDNPIAWSQFKRKGGLSNMAGVAAGYMAIITVIIFVTVRINPDYASNVYAGWSIGLLALQTLFIVIMGAGRVASMIRGDIASGIIESHRMMPMPAGHAVAGYLTAALASFSGFFIATLALGAVTTALAQLPVSRWIAANLILLSFAIFVWVVAAFAAFLAAKGSGAVIAIASLGGFFGNAGILFVVPGILVLLGPLIGGSIFNLRMAQTDLSLPLILSFCAQILVGTIFFTGAARKYRRPDALALGGYLAELLLLAFVALSVLSIVRWEEFQPGFMARSFQGTDPVLPFLGSCVFCMLLALTPLCNFARQHVAWTRLRADDPEASRTVPGPFICGLLVTITLALLLFASPQVPTRTELSYTLAAFFGFSLSVIFLAAWVYRIVDKAPLFIGIWLFIYGLVPMIVDLTRHSMSDDPHDRPFQLAAAFSPIGLLIQTWIHADVDLRLPAAVHLFVPLLPLVLYARDTFKSRSTEATPPLLAA